MELEKKDYSKTVNLPKTDFQMRAGLPEKEPKILEEVFEGKHIYENISHRSEWISWSRHCRTYS